MGTGQMEEWIVNKPLGYCCGTNRKIEPGEEYYSALVEMPDGLQRRDFCVEYWQSVKPPVYCYWKTRLPQRDSRRPVFVDDEMLLSFFNRLENETDEEKAGFRFVLMLILMRKRILKYDGTDSRDGREVWRLRVVGGDKEFVDVVNPHFDESRIQQLSSQIGTILQVDLSS